MWTHHRGKGGLKGRHKGCYRRRNVPQTHRPISVGVAEDSRYLATNLGSSTLPVCCVCVSRGEEGGDNA